MILIYNFVIWITLLYIFNFLEKYYKYSILDYVIPILIIIITIVNYIDILILLYLDKSLIIFSIINYSICNIVLREVIYITNTWKILFFELYFDLILLSLIISIFLIGYWLFLIL